MLSFIKKKKYKKDSIINVGYYSKERFSKECFVEKIKEKYKNKIIAEKYDSISLKIKGYIVNIRFLSFSEGSRGYKNDYILLEHNSIRDYKDFEIFNNVVRPTVFYSLDKKFENPDDATLETRIIHL